MTYSTAYNATAGALVVDRAGRVIGAREFGSVKADQQPAKGLLESGQLVAVEPRKGDDVAPEAAAAFAATEQLNAGEPAPQVDAAAELEDDAVAAPADEQTTTTRGRRARTTTEA